MTVGAFMISSTVTRRMTRTGAAAGGGGGGGGGGGAVKDTAKLDFGNVAVIINGIRTTMPMMMTSQM